MEATNQQPVTLVDAILATVVVSPEEQARARKADDERRAAAKARRKYDEALRRDKLADIERNNREAAERLAAEAAAETPVAEVKVPFKGILKHADPKEAERVRAETERNEAKKLADVRHKAAERVRGELIKWLTKGDLDGIPSPVQNRERIVREFEGALFMPVDGEDGAYACEGVVIHLDAPARIAEWEAHQAKERVQRVFRGTDLTAKLAVLEKEGFVFAEEDNRGNRVFVRNGVEVTLFLRGERPASASRHNSNQTDLQRAAAERRKVHTPGNKEGGSGNGESRRKHGKSGKKRMTKAEFALMKSRQAPAADKPAETKSKKKDKKDDKKKTK